MRVIAPVEQEIRRAIRDARAKDPIIPITKLQEQLERQFNREFSRAYLTKLSNKVARETRIELDRAKIEDRMAFTRENYRIARERLMKIIEWTPDPNNPIEKAPGHLTVVEAAKSIVMLDLAILKAEIETGTYRKPVEELAKGIHYEPLPGEVRTVIISSWMRGGLLPQQTIEQMVPTLPTHEETAN